MDFIFGLPRAKGRDREWRDGVMTVVDRATKRKTLVAVHEGITAVEAADLFLLWAVRPFGVPQEIISDRDPRFMSRFWQQVFARLGTRLLHSTAHHSRMVNLSGHTGSLSRCSARMSLAAHQTSGLTCYSSVK